MGFVVAKTIMYLIQPPSGQLIMILFGFLVLKPCRTFGRILIGAGLLMLYALAISPVSDALLKPLESGAVCATEQKVRPDAIVVFGGGVRDLSWRGQPSEPGEMSLERIVKGVTLSREFRVPLVITGGNGDPAGTGVTDAEAMARTARELGVKAKDMIIEDGSRNTLESARAMRRLIRGKTVIAVTSAYHLRRASGMLEKQGFAVIAGPAGYRCEQKKLSWYSFIPNAESLDLSSMAFSEYVSLVWYSLHGDL